MKYYTAVNMNEQYWWFLVVEYYVNSTSLENKITKINVSSLSHVCCVYTLYICIYVYTCICVYVHVHVYAYVCLYMYTYMYV